MLGRRKARGRLEQPRQHRRLLGAQLLRLAVEIVQASGAQPVLVVAEIGVRKVAFEDLVLGQPAFEPQRDQRLARLAGDRLLGGEEGELSELLGDGRAAAITRPRRPGDAARVDAPVRVEPPVLDRDEGLRDMGRQILDLDRGLDDRALPRDRGAVARQQRDLRRGDGFKALGERRGDSQPGDQQGEERQCRHDAAPGPPQLAARAPVIALPPAQAALFLDRERLIDQPELGVPFVEVRICRNARARQVVIILVIVGTRGFVEREEPCGRACALVCARPGAFPESVEERHG